MLSGRLSQSPLSSGSLVSFVPSQRWCIWRAVLWLVPPVGVPGMSPGWAQEWHFGQGPGSATTFSPVRWGSDARLPLGLATLAVPVGGACVFPPWLTSCPWGDLRRCQRPGPADFVPLGSVFLTHEPVPVRWSSVSTSLLPAGQCPGAHAFESNPSQCCTPFLSLF